MKMEKMKIENMRQQKEEELKSHNNVLKCVQEEEYGNSFKQNDLEVVDDIDR